MNYTSVNNPFSGYPATLRPPLDSLAHHYWDTSYSLFSFIFSPYFFPYVLFYILYFITALFWTVCSNYLITQFIQLIYLIILFFLRIHLHIFDFGKCEHSLSHCLLFVHIHYIYIFICLDYLPFITVLVRAEPLYV